MLLQKLKQYADDGRIENLAPVSYKVTPIRYVIELDEHGKWLGCIDQAQGGSVREKRGKQTVAPHIGRSSGVRAKLLADNAEYALGIARDPDKQTRVDESHQAFVALVRECADQTGEAAVRGVQTFLEAGTDVRECLPVGFDPGAVVTFRVGETLPIDLPTVRNYWARRNRGEADGALDDESTTVSDRMQCLVCGQSGPVKRRLDYKWQGVPGGQSAGLAIISANAEAFVSYGLEESLIAPTCPDCGERFSKAANALLADRATSLRVGPIAYIFWTRERIDFSFGSFLDDPNPTVVRELYQSPRTARSAASKIDDTPFYAAAISASGARVVVRDWLDTTVGRAKENLRRYFDLQRIVDWEGASPPLTLHALALATVRKPKNLSAGTPRALLGLALEGGALPHVIMFEAIRRCRAEGKVTRPRAALIKMVLLTNSSRLQKESLPVPQATLESLDLTNRDPAYLCGRLLAVLESIQRAALGDINATIVDRYYGTASSAPASVFSRLLRGAQPHLGKLRRDPRKQAAHRALQNRLMDIMNSETGLSDFPRVLSLPSQGLFALGYYHQRAADRAAVRNHQAPAAIVANSGIEGDGSEISAPNPN